MNDNLTTTSEIALEVIDAAASKITLKEFELRCRLAPVRPGKSFFDFKRVAESLIADGTINLIDGRLNYNSLIITGILRDELTFGNKLAWNILERIDPNGEKAYKFNSELLSQIGLNGENFFIDYLCDINSSFTRSNIRHVSLIDDSAGFDIIAPSLVDHSKNMLVEVKTSTRPGQQFHFYLSRNEARVGSLNRNWYIACVSCQKLNHSLVGHLLFEDIIDLLPTDTSSSARWESARLKVSKDIIRKDIP